MINWLRSLKIQFRLRPLYFLALNETHLELTLKIHNKHIGKLILSSEFGVGRIMSVNDLGIQGRFFYAVEILEKKLKNYLDVEKNESYRFVATLEEIQETFNKLKKRSIAKEFTAQKERVHYFKELSKVQTLESLSSTLLELNGVEKRTPIENDIYQRIINTLAEEHVIITGADIDRSKAIINSNLKGEEDE